MRVNLPHNPQMIYVTGDLDIHDIVLAQTAEVKRALKPETKSQQALTNNQALLNTFGTLVTNNTHHY